MWGAADSRQPRPFQGKAGQMTETGKAGHPSWCVRHHCTANQGRTGAHRSKPVIIDGTKVSANLYASAAEPEAVYVEVHAEVLLPARDAYGLGRILMSLGRAARDASTDVA